MAPDGTNNPGANIDKSPQASSWAGWAGGTGAAKTPSTPVTPRHETEVSNILSQTPNGTGRGNAPLSGSNVNSGTTNASATTGKDPQTPTEGTPVEGLVQSVLTGQKSLKDVTQEEWDSLSDPDKAELRDFNGGKAPSQVVDEEEDNQADGGLPLELLLAAETLVFMGAVIDNAIKLHRPHLRRARARGRGKGGEESAAERNAREAAEGAAEGAEGGAKAAEAEAATAKKKLAEAQEAEIRATEAARTAKGEEEIAKTGEALEHAKRARILAETELRVKTATAVRMRQEAMSALKLASELKPAGGGLMKLVKVGGRLTKGTIVAIAVVQVARALISVASAPEGQSTQKTVDDALNILNPFSDAATGQILEGNLSGAAVTAAGDLAHGAVNLGKDILSLAQSAAEATPGAVKTVSDFLHAHPNPLQYAATNVSDFFKLVREHPAEARKVAMASFDAVKAMLPSGSELHEMVAAAPSRPKDGTHPAAVLAYNEEQ